MSIRPFIMIGILFILITGIFGTNLDNDNSEEASAEPLSGLAMADENETGKMPVQDFDKYFKEYFTVPEINENIQRLASEHPKIARIEDIILPTDQGSTWGGRPLYAVKISDNVDIEEPDEPKFVVFGNIHAREWMAYEAPMYFIFHLLENYNMPPTDNDMDGKINEDMFNGKDDDNDGLVDEDWSEARVTWLVNNREIWVIPTQNPDGTIIDHEMFEAGSGSWRKNIRDNNGNGRFEPDFDGVDLNRNYAYYWDANQQGIVSIDGIEQTLDSSIPNSGVYRGPQDNFDDDGDSLIPIREFWDPRYREDRNGIDEDPWDGIDNDGDGKVDEDKDGGFSEPETQAIDIFMNRLDSDGNHHNMRSDVGITMSYHSVGGWVIWPWGHTLAPPQHNDLLEYIGHEFMDQTGYASWKDDNMYMVSGDSDDYYYGVHGILAYTIELNDEPGAGFHPPPDMIINTSRKVLTCNLYAAEMTGIAKVAKELDYPDLDIDLPVLTHQQRHKVYSSQKNYVVKVNVENYRNIDPNSLVIHYRIGKDGMYRTVRMTDTGDVIEGNSTMGEMAVYTGTIPSQPDHDGSMVYYYITGEDVRGLAVFGPKYGESEPYSYKLDSRIGFTLFDAAVAIIMAIIFIVIVWGGFFKGVHTAIRADRRKARLR